MLIVALLSMLTEAPWKPTAIWLTPATILATASASVGETAVA
jgi:hypothetical protein